ncbi:vWA domain-containing protein [Marinobacterium litorale]|uniref:vWA domain-containing protein n=1 Tax=Marinobacterium litorale TaxID=404770 RepID=UPI000429EF72|nr:VWA-like domain-containing protein [Marinobacterium litorale]
MTSLAHPFAKQLDKAKIGLMSKHNSVFISTVLFSLKQVWKPDLSPDGGSCGATDGKHLFIQPTNFINLSPDQRIWLIAHEAWHVAFKHLFRKGDRDHQLWNIAADHVINTMLKNSGYDVPEGRPCNMDFLGKSTEEVYDILKKEQEQNGGAGNKPEPNGSGQGNDQGVWTPGSSDGDIMDPFESMSPEEAKAVEEEVNGILIKAATQSRMQNEDPGHIPGEVGIMIENLTNPKLPWNQILRNYVSGFAKNDFTFKRPNRRFFPDHYLPSQYSEAMTDITIAVDTSGSVTDEQFTDFISECQGIKDEFLPEKMTIIDFDTSIKDIKKFNECEDLRSVEFHGRGGTSIKPVLKWAKENQPTVMLIFTDGYFSMYDVNPGCPVIWVIHSRDESFEYPFGTILNYPT